jgi:6-phosphofructokinase 2
MLPIVTVTLSPAVDLSSETERVQPTRKTRTTNDRFEPGGGGINVARVVAELQGDALAVSIAGGATGALLDELLEREGIRRRLLWSDVPTRLSHVVYERATELEFRFVPTGWPVPPGKYQECLGVLEELDFAFLVASGSLPPDAPTDVLVRISEIAARKQAKFILDTSGDALKTTLGRARVYLAKPSLNELEGYVGRPLRTPSEQEAAVAELVRSGAAEMIALTLGAEGAVLATAGGIRRAAAISIEVKSAVGAGDSFVGAMTLALAQGKSPPEAFERGMAAGTAALLAPGTQLCRRTDVERIYGEILASKPEPAAGMCD